MPRIFPTVQAWRSCCDWLSDPPHGDRIPYLELSEIWNVILGEEPPFEAEIVVSNAKDRSKKSLG